MAQVCWAAPNMLATAAIGRDTAVRLYNFETEENHLLQVRGVGSMCCALTWYQTTFKEGT